MNLLKQIESKNIASDQLQIYFLGQSGYVLSFKKMTIYIDPYLTDYIENPLGLNEQKMFRSFPSPIDPELISKCDAIICTHSHFDHMDPWTINKINTDYKLFASIGAYEKSEVNIPSSKIEFPIFIPLALRNVYAAPPAIIILSALSRSFAIAVILSLIFEPPMITTNGCSTSTIIFDINCT